VNLDIILPPAQGAIRQFLIYFELNSHPFSRLLILSRFPLTAWANWVNIDIMRTEQYRTKELAAFLRRHKIATLDQLKKVLGDPTERTVFRKLEAMSYLSSHRDKIRVDFDFLPIL